MKKIILASVLGVVILTLGLILSSKQEEIFDQPIPLPVDSSKSSSFDSQISNEGGVEVSVTPIDLKAGSEFWSFEVAMNTHSVELDQDMVANSLMEVGDGKSHNPVSWEGDPTGGHHRSGVLKFKSLSPLPSDISIKIKGVGEVLDRVFRWSIK